MSTSFSASFSNIDQASDPLTFVDFMDDANAMAFFRAAKRRTYDLLALAPGSHVLDIGCGAGEDVRAMAEIVGPTGRAVGVDGSATMIAAARERSEALALPTEFFVDDAQHLRFSDATFDGCRTDRVLLHLSDPALAIAEMARVLRRGGRAVAFEPDNGGLLVDGADREITQKIMYYRSEEVRSGWIGRQLRRRFKDAGLVDVEVHVLPSPRTDYTHANASLNLGYYAERAAEAGVVTAHEAAAWSESLAAAGEAGCFFCIVTMFMAVGRKP